MHWWHAVHLADWGRSHLLEKSLDWYLTHLDVARDTAHRQHYAGARWPKHVGPEGREGPSDIGWWWGLEIAQPRRADGQARCT
jgi:hypothetical protein